MSKKGGYVIVDLKGQSITAGTPFTLDGVTARLDRAKNKACLLSGFAIGNDEKRDVFVDLQPTEDGYAGTVDGYQITIEDDEVTFNAMTDNSLKVAGTVFLKTSYDGPKFFSVPITASTSKTSFSEIEITGFTFPTNWKFALLDSINVLSYFGVPEGDYITKISIYNKVGAFSNVPTLRVDVGSDTVIAEGTISIEVYGKLLLVDF